MNGAASTRGAVRSARRAAPPPPRRRRPAGPASAVGFAHGTLLPQLPPGSSAPPPRPPADFRRRSRRPRHLDDIAEGRIDRRGELRDPRRMGPARSPTRRQPKLAIQPKPSIQGGTSMSAPDAIPVTSLAKLIGTPRCPTLLDVRAEEARAEDPRLAPGGAAARPGGARPRWARRPRRRRFPGPVVAICAEGIAAARASPRWLRHDGVAGGIPRGRPGRLGRGRPSPRRCRRRSPPATPTAAPSGSPAPAPRSTASPAPG